MTRIYEGLQLAGFKQNSAPSVEELEFPAPTLPSDLKEPLPEHDDINPETIPQYQWKPATESLVTLARRGVGVEQFRRLRSRISVFRDEVPIKTILVCSGMPEEGKSFVAANLAMSMARNGNKNILLIDGDLRRPRLHELLGAPASPGLSEYLAGTVSLTEIMQRDVSSRPLGNGIDGVSALTFIPAGKCGDNSSELAANRRIDHMIKRLSPHFDWILIDASPALVVTDAVDLARAADAVLLVARAGITRFEEAQRTQAAFSGSRILGVVLNALKGASGKDYYYNYYGTESTGG